MFRILLIPFMKDPCNSDCLVKATCKKEDLDCPYFFKFSQKVDERADGYDYPKFSDMPLNKKIIGSLFIFLLCTLHPKKHGKDFIAQFGEWLTEKFGK